MTFAKDAHALVELLEHYRRESAAKARPVTRLAPLAKLIGDLDLAAITREGQLGGERLSSFVERYLACTTRLHHPAYLAHQVGVPHHAGALGGFIDAFTNNPMAIYEMGPGAAAIEFFVINWLLEKVGWQPAPLEPSGEPLAPCCGGGVLTHGGSLANLTALAAARSRAAPKVWAEGGSGELAILAPAQAHYSIARAAAILGIGAQGVIALDADARGVVRPDRLPLAWERAVRAGRRPVALVANACSTAVGLYDPLREIGTFCREHHLWFHVDGAHGASALLSPKYRRYLAGLDQADSLIWDAHKMLRTPAVCTAVLVRDHRTLDEAFQADASYLFHDKDQPGVDFIHRTVECTKAGLGLKLFMVLGALGEARLGAYVERQYDIARAAYELIRSQPDFRCPVQPQSNILCFRFQDLDAEHLRLRDRLIAAGSFHLSTTSWNGHWHLRLVFMNPDTGLGEIRDLLEEIRRQARAV